MKNKEAVSEVIGVVLLLGITLVLASVMFLWVSSIVFQSGSAPVGDISIEKKETGSPSTVNYTVTLNSFRPKTDPKDIICYFYDEYIPKGSFDFPATPNPVFIKVNISGVEKSGSVTWTNDDNNMVSSYDVIKISIAGMGNENDRKTLSTYSFSLRYKPNGILIAEETL